MAQDHEDQAQGTLAGTLSGIGKALTKIGIGASIIGVFAFIWFSGLAETLFPSTNGVIHIGSPQIYTRERLVNDRFRERAWLESQLKKIENQEVQVSAAIRSRTAFATGGEKPDVVEPGATPSIQPDAGFSYLRNTRATIREALIENELDDRHDLGSNSLYQFNFGAAIAAGTRTRRVAKIKMTIEPDDRLEPLDQLIDAKHPLAGVCDGLREFECAYLLELGILENTETEAGTAIVEQYRKWRLLFDKWLEAENALYRREAEDVEKLFRQSLYNSGLPGLQEQFLRNLDDRAALYTRALREATRQDVKDIEERCNTLNARSIISATAIASSPAAESLIKNFVSECVDATNDFLGKGLNPAALDSYVSTFSKSAKRAAYDKSNFSVLSKELLCRIGGLCEGTSPEGHFAIKDLQLEFAQISEEIANTAMLHVFESFSEQCSWGFSVVEKDPADGPSSFRLSSDVPARLRGCIINSAVRDFGSHPFGKLLRGTRELHSKPSTTRGTKSFYRAREGLSSILSINSADNFRAQARYQYVGVVAHDEDGPPRILIYEAFPRPRSALPAECAGGGDSNIRGISGGYYLDETNPFVSDEIGWDFLSILVCDTYQRSGKPDPDMKVADNSYNIPIGLFRFIHHLSNSQRTFSYSVQPSGSFDLEQQESQNYLGLPLSRTGENAEGQGYLSSQTAAASIEKRYKIIGFGTQIDGPFGSAPDGQPEARQAEFGWYVFPAPRRDKLFSRDTMKPVNVKLSAVVSVPAWWDSVKIRTATEWLYPDSLGGEKLVKYVDKETTGNPKKDMRQQKVRELEDTLNERQFRVELPLRLDFIRNHFLGADTLRPTVYQLHILHNRLTACQPAEIVIKGERLWRSTVVTLDGQKASLIQVMPDMRGIVAVFDEIQPQSWEDDVFRPTITIWTSEGQVALRNTVDVHVPTSVKSALEQGKPACGERKP